MFFVGFFALKFDLVLQFYPTLDRQTFLIIFVLSGAQIHDQHHSETYDDGAARVVLFGVPLWLDVKPPRVILQVSLSNHDIGC